MSDMTIITVSQTHFNQISELCAERRIDVDDARDALYDYFDEHLLDLNASGIASEDGLGLIFFGPPMFVARVAHADDYYGMFDEDDEVIIYAAVEDGIAGNLDAALAGEVDELEEDVDVERIDVYYGDADIVFSNFEWFEAAPSDPEDYKQLMSVVYMAYLEAIDA
jgi:hypothetical protein